MMHFNPWRLAVLASGSRAEFVDVSFASRNRLMHALVPSNELWITVKDVLVMEEYELYEKFRLDDISQDATVVDAGAFVGLYSLKVSPYAKSVIALEPSRRNYSILAHNLRLNASTNIRPNPLALSSKRGKAYFRDVMTHSSSALSDREAEGSYEVESVTLDDVVQEHGEIDLLKMDIEGAEYEVLLSAGSATLRKVRRIVGEIHISSSNDYARLSKMVSRLRESGMSVKILVDREKGLRYGLTKPIRCSLRRFNGRSTLPYRIFVSSVYAFSPLLYEFKSIYDTGNKTLLFGFRS